VTRLSNLLVKRGDRPAQRRQFLDDLVARAQNGAPLGDRRVGLGELEKPIREPLALGVETQRVCVQISERIVGTLPKRARVRFLPAPRCPVCSRSSLHVPVPTHSLVRSLLTPAETPYMGHLVDTPFTAVNSTVSQRSLSDWTALCLYSAPSRDMIGEPLWTPTFSHERRLGGESHMQLPRESTHW
jgi:hypothetical protein